MNGIDGSVSDISIYLRQNNTCSRGGRSKLKRFLFKTGYDTSPIRDPSGDLMRILISGGSLTELLNCYKSQEERIEAIYLG